MIKLIKLAIKFQPIVRLASTSTKRKLLKDIHSKSDNLKLVAYSTADEYDLNSLKKTLIRDNLYEIIEFDAKITNDIDKNLLLLKAKYNMLNTQIPREAFIFQDGTCVFWNMSDKNELNSLITLVNSYSINKYDDELIENEKELLTFSHDTNSENSTRLNNNNIYLSSDDANQLLLEKYAFSDAISLSVKLAIWENNLESLITSIEHVTQDLKNGRETRLTSKQVLQKTGELLMLRNLVNLRSDILDTPDFYWNRDDLEKLYSRTIRYLDISKRTKVFNEKLNNCLDLMQILKSHLNDEKHTRLEWFIILLIMLETFFGILSYLTRF
jgi:required for meiotic nuclear division protein 1